MSGGHPWSCWLAARGRRDCGEREDDAEYECRHWRVCSSSSHTGTSSRCRPCGGAATACRPERSGESLMLQSPWRLLARESYGWTSAGPQVEKVGISSRASEPCDKWPAAGTEAMTADPAATSERRLSANAASLHRRRNTNGLLLPGSAPRAEPGFPCTDHLRPLPHRPGRRSRLRVVTRVARQGSGLSSPGQRVIFQGEGLPDTREAA